MGGIYKRPAARANVLLQVVGNAGGGGQAGAGEKQQALGALHERGQRIKIRRLDQGRARCEGRERRLRVAARCVEEAAHA